jgi:hypothetical protein
MQTDPYRANATDRTDMITKHGRPQFHIDA